MHPKKDIIEISELAKGNCQCSLKKLVDFGFLKIIESKYDIKFYKSTVADGASTALPAAEIPPQEGKANTKIHDVKGDVTTTKDLNKAMKYLERGYTIVKVQTVIYMPDGFVRTIVAWEIKE